MKKYAQLTGLLGVGVLLCSACTPTLSTRVSSFRAPGPLEAGARLCVVADAPELEKSLEFGWYKGLLEQSLQKQGFSVTPCASAQVLARLSYGVKRVEAGRSGGVQTGFVTASPRQPFGFGTQVLVVDEPKTAPTYERSLRLVLLQNSPQGQHLYEVTAVNEGRCGVLLEAFPSLLQAVFTAFPAENASVKTVAVPAAAGCK